MTSPEIPAGFDTGLDGMRLLGRGLACTGQSGGWPSSADFVYRCAACGDSMAADRPSKFVCGCGSMQLDIGSGSFGSRHGDQNALVYRRLVAASPAVAELPVAIDIGGTLVLGVVCIGAVVAIGSGVLVLMLYHVVRFVHDGPSLWGCAYPVLLLAGITFLLFTALWLLESVLKWFELRRLHRLPSHELEARVFRTPDDYLSFLGEQSQPVRRYRHLVGTRNAAALARELPGLLREFDRLERAAGHRGRSLAYDEGFDELACVALSQRRPAPARPPWQPLESAGS